MSDRVQIGGIPKQERDWGCNRCGAPCYVMKQHKGFDREIPTPLDGIITAALNRQNPPPPGQLPAFADDDNARVKLCPVCAPVIWDALTAAAPWVFRRRGEPRAAIVNERIPEDVQ